MASRLSNLVGVARAAVLMAAAVFFLCGIGVAWVVSVGQEDAGNANAIAPVSYRDVSDEPAPTGIVNLPAGVDANFMAQVNACFLPLASTYGYDLRITDGYRTLAEQDAIYEQGRSEDGHIVTEVGGGRSLHNFGFAVDVADRARGYRINWNRLGRIAAYCSLEQNEAGDQAHFAYRAGLSIEQFQAGQRPPTLVLPCALMDDRADAGEPLMPQDLAECGLTASSFDN